MMLEVNSSLNPRPVPPRKPDAPEVMQAFVGRHIALLILAVVLLLQFLVLGYQVTRKHNVRLITVWAVEGFDPFERSVRGLTSAVSGAFHSFGSLSAAREENQQLRTQLAEARAESRELSEDGAENTQLRSLLDLQRRLPLRTIAASVIAASPGTASAIYIDRGQADGLTSDEPVITPDGVVGKTVTIFHNTAQVLLITDRSSGAGAMLKTSRDQGVLNGAGDGLCVLDYVMNGTAVRPGEQVVTSGLDQIYPTGLLLGTVTSVRPGNIYQTIRVKPAANLDRLEEVLVVLGQRPQAAGAVRRNQRR